MQSRIFQHALIPSVVYVWVQHALTLGLSEFCYELTPGSGSAVFLTLGYSHVSLWVEYMRVLAHWRGNISAQVYINPYCSLDPFLVKHVLTPFLPHVHNPFYVYLS